jgi:hypothetical protein
MLYCEECRKDNGWPEAFAGAYGACEVCGKVDFNYDRKSAYLPPATTLKVINGIYYRKSDGLPASLKEVREEAERYRDWEQNLERVPY